MTPAGVANPTPCLALDIGGTKAEAAVVTPEGVILRRERADVKAAGSQLFERIVELLARLRGDDEVSSLGVACVITDDPALAREVVTRSSPTGAGR